MTETRNTQVEPAYNGLLCCTPGYVYCRKQIAYTVKGDSEFVKAFQDLTTDERALIQQGANTDGRCPSFSKVIKPLRARDVLGESRLIVNVEGLEQELLLNVCRFVRTMFYPPFPAITPFQEEKKREIIAFL